ncbi:MAG: thermonuclease family protein [Elusimicrobiota bacterium]|nr:thermonuclease family protein [Elusimicrobiota bacterium]
MEAGLAWVYVQYCKIPQCEDWQKLQEKAKSLKRGLWQEPDPIPPWQWRKQQRK